MTFRTYHDPLHKGIVLDSNKPEEAMIMELIDTLPFQRLRRIKQLGPASLTFHGAESSRFTHSLGVFEIARRALKRLEIIDPTLKKYRGILYGAALLHDIGHGPFSHTSEEIFEINHEYWSSKLIKDYNDIKIILERFKEGTSIQISNIIINKFMGNKAIKTLLSSQLDCDRLDYLLRDSYSTGTIYGQLDLGRILSGLTIAPDGDLAIHPKGLLAVEHYLFVRNLMYRSVYNHRMNEVCNWLLEKIIKTARSFVEGEIWADKHMTKWLWEIKTIDFDTFLANDDILTNYHLSRWKEDSPRPLAELCKRFINRDLPKAIDINFLSKEKQLESLSIARQLTEKSGLNPDILCGIREKKYRGYDPYKEGLRLWDGKDLKSIEKSSLVIQSLVKTEQSCWLIYPKEINKDLNIIISRLKDDQSIY